MNDLKGKKDQVVGKVKEDAGKAVNNDETELKGKVQHASGKIKAKLSDVKEKTAEKINKVLDK